MSIDNYSRKRAFKWGSTRRFQQKPLVCAVALALVGGVVLPATGWAATVSGVKFIDKDRDGGSRETIDGILEPIYNGGGTIYLKSTIAPADQYPSTAQANFSTGVYNFVDVFPGTYKIWQYVNPTSPIYSMMTGESASKYFTSFATAKIITVASTSTDVTHDFPVPALPLDAMTYIVDAQTRANLVCSATSEDVVTISDGTLTNPFVLTSGLEDKILIVAQNAVVKVTGSQHIQAVCNKGTLFSDNEVQIEYDDFFANLDGGKIEGSSISLQRYFYQDIQSTAGCDSGSEYASAFSNCDYYGLFYNAGSIQGKDGRNRVHPDTKTISSANLAYYVGGNGGAVSIEGQSVVQNGTIQGGKGGNVNFNESYYWTWSTDQYLKVGGDGGAVTVAADSNGTLTGGASSVIESGQGGDVSVTNPCVDSPGNCSHYALMGGWSGELTVTGRDTILKGTYRGSSIYVDPTVSFMGSDTTLIANKDVVIFGGDNWLLELKNLKPEGITAGNKIILATGPGGTIDLRGNNAKIFKAGVQVEIYTDNLLLDAGVAIENLVDAPNGVVRGNAKIIYHAVITGSSQLTGKTGDTLPMSLTVRNAGPKQDTYTLVATSQMGSTVSGLPATVTIDGLKRADLNLNVTLPVASDDIITVIATSQADPTVVATMQIQTTVEAVVSTRTLFGTLKDKYGNPLAGVTVQISGKTVTTDINGYWEMTGMAEGSYTITAIKDNFVFLPASLDVTTTSADKQEIKIVTDREPYDVWVSDPAPDNGSEPSKTTWIWTSPDIWVRNQDDNGMAYQNVVFGQDNWVYVRARNRGTLPIQNTKVEIYRSGASMGQSWPRGWELVGTANVAELQPNATETLHIKWDKEKIAKPGHYCFYARLLNDKDPMFVAETSDMVGNTFRNNNIAWRNFNVVGLLTKVTDKFEVGVGNPTNATVKVDLVFDEPENLLQNDGARAIVDLGPTLFQRWQQAGGQGENVVVLTGTLVQILATPAKFIGIPLEVGEELPISMQVDAFKPAPGAGTSREYHFTTQEWISGELVGGVDYAITTRAQDTDSDRDSIKDVVDDDNDNDGIPDEWEIKYGLNPLEQADAVEDLDGDGKTNLEEFREGSGSGNSKASGILKDGLGNPLANVTVHVGDRTTVTNEQGEWEINDLVEGKYTVNVTQNGYQPISQAIEVGNDQPINVTSKLASQLTVQAVAKPSVAKQGENITYTLTVTNKGTVAANNIVLEDTLPMGTGLISTEIKGGTCEASRCTLTSLQPGETTQIKFSVSNSQTNKLENKVVITSDEYPTETAVTWTPVMPYLSVSLSDTPDPIPLNLVQGEALRYTAQVNLDTLATAPASGVKLKFSLPNGLAFKAVNTDKGTCDSSGLPVIACQLTDLDVGGQATVTVDTQLQDLGLMALTADAEVSADNYPLHTDKERTTIQIPAGVEVDIALVVDDTGSMQGEIDATVQALEKFIATIKPEDAPLIAFLTFKDEVTVKFFGRDLNLLLKTVKGLKVSGGGMCPEASVEALNAAIPHVKQGGSILFVTDASPYDDADLEKLAGLLQSKAIRLNSIVTGDCSDQNSWNSLEESQ